MDNLKLITMSDVASENINFLWKPYIAYGKITIVQGDPGEGKTTMMLAIAASVTRGESLSEGGGDAALSPSAVIFQTAEMGWLIPSNRALSSSALSVTEFTL